MFSGLLQVHIFDTNVPPLQIRQNVRPVLRVDCLGNGSTLRYQSHRHSVARDKSLPLLNGLLNRLGCDRNTAVAYALKYGACKPDYIVWIGSSGLWYPPLAAGLSLMVDDL